MQLRCTSTISYQKTEMHLQKRKWCQLYKILVYFLHWDFIRSNTRSRCNCLNRNEVNYICILVLNNWFCYNIAIYIVWLLLCSWFLRFIRALDAACLFLIIYKKCVRRYFKKYVQNEHTAVDCTLIYFLLLYIHIVS